MNSVPRAAALWGVLGLLPFFYGAALTLAPESLPSFRLVEPGPDAGARILERFGAVILAFMGGCLWGFASTNRMPSFLRLGGSALPAFIAFFALAFEPALACIVLAFGFAVLQGLDFVYARTGIAPAYWLSLRLPLTAVVMACLLVGALYG